MSRPKQSQKLPTASPTPDSQPAPKASPEATRELLQADLVSARARRLKLQGKPYKDNDDKLKLLALDVRIGQLLLQLEDTP